MGIAGAVLAAVAYGAATVLQAVGVARWRRTGRRARAAGPYVAGLVLDLLGFVASATALRTLPLFLVQSMIASSVAVTAVLAVGFLGLRLGRREWLALGVIVLGLIGLAVSAAEGPAQPVGPATGWLLLGAAGGCGVLLLAGRRSGTLLSVAAGLGFGAVGIAARTLVIADPWWRTIGQATLWALVANAVVAIVAYGVALDRARVTVVAAITFSIETVVPAAVGWGWLGDAVRPGFGGAALGAFALTLVGCLALAHHAEVAPGDAGSCANPPGEGPFPGPPEA